MAVLAGLVAVFVAIVTGSTGAYSNLFGNQAQRDGVAVAKEGLELNRQKHLPPVNVTNVLVDPATDPATKLYEWKPEVDAGPPSRLLPGPPAHPPSFPKNPCPSMYEFVVPRSHWDSPYSHLSFHCDEAVFFYKGLHTGNRRVLRISVRGRKPTPADPEARFVFDCDFRCELDGNNANHVEKAGTCAAFGASTVKCSDPDEIRVITSRAF